MTGPGTPVVCFACGRGDVIASLAAFSFPRAEAMDLVPEHTSRALNREFEDKLIMTVARPHGSPGCSLPAPVTTALAVIRSVKYIWEGLSALWHWPPVRWPCWTPPPSPCPWPGAISPPPGP